ncbi:hypothetical protein WAC87_002101 [Shigella flexneri]
MDISVKVDLEDKIKEKYTIGYYEFDEINNCFWGDAEIELYLYEIDTDIWRSRDVWYSMFLRITEGIKPAGKNMRCVRSGKDLAA